MLLPTQYSLKKTTTFASRFMSPIMCNFITHGPCPQKIYQSKSPQGHILHYDGAQTWCRHEHVDPWAKIKHTLKTKGKGPMTFALTITYYHYTCSFKFEFWMSFANLVSFRTIDASWKDGRWVRKRKGNPFKSWKWLDSTWWYLMSLEFMSRFWERTQASTIQTIFIKQA